MPLENVEFLPARCPNCGASMQVPEDLEKAHCMFCGSMFIISQKKHPGRDASSDRAFSVDNFVKLMILSLSAGDEGKAMEYLTRAREMDYDSAERILKQKAGQLYQAYKLLMIRRCQHFISTVAPAPGTQGSAARMVDWNRNLTSISGAMNIALAYIPQGDAELHSWYGTTLVHHSNAFVKKSDKDLVLRTATDAFFRALALNPSYAPAVDSLARLGYACTTCGGKGVCPTCRGTGLCRKCHGSGKTESLIGKRRQCDACDGSGQCRQCAGSRTCVSCGGHRLNRRGT